MKSEEHEDDLKEITEVLVDVLKLFDVSGRCGEEEHETTQPLLMHLGWCF